MPQTLQLCERSSEIQMLVKRVAGARRVVVVTGAGISVNCGIPDFRSSTGLFQQIQAAHSKVVSKGRDLFDASVVFRSEQAANVFYEWMTHLRHQCADAQPGVVHQFIRELADRGMLLRSYTQNIDGLERKAGLAVWDPYKPKDSPQYVSWQQAQSVPLHGTMEHLYCQLCSSSFPFSEQPGGTALSAGDVCADCMQRSEIREALGRRSLPAGKLRPAVVLYQEPHPHSEDIAKIISHDTRALKSRRTSHDIILVFGTTLKVPGCRQLVKQLATASPQSTTILVNNEPVCGRMWDGIVDYQVIGCVDDWCTRIRRVWNSQTKITRWTATTKSAARKENNCGTLAAVPQKTLSRKRKAVGSETDEPGCKQQCVVQELPARRSKRIATRSHLDRYQQQQSQRPLSICT